MNNKGITSKKQSNVADNTISNKNVTPYAYRPKTTSEDSSNDPFYSPPGEGPKPRITSN